MVGTQLDPNGLPTRCGDDLRRVEFRRQLYLAVHHQPDPRVPPARQGGGRGQGLDYKYFNDVHWDDMMAEMGMPSSGHVITSHRGVHEGVPFTGSGPGSESGSGNDASGSGVKKEDISAPKLD